MRREAETEDRHGAEGEDRLGDAAGTGDSGGSSPALSGAREPDLRLEEIDSGQRRAGVPPGGGRRG